MTCATRLALIACLGLGLLAVPVPGTAQPRPRAQPTPPAPRTEPAPAAPVAPPVAGNPGTPELQGAAPVFTAVTPGLCFFSRAAAIGGSKAGLAATVSMQQLASEVSAELNSQRQGIGSGTDGAAGVQQRANGFSQLEQIRGLQLQRTKLLVEQQIAQAIGPLIDPIVAKRACSVLIERSTAYGWNPAMDITPQVIQELDLRLPSVPVALVPSSGP